MMNTKRVKHNESGVSEAIGYILILGIMITGIGLITLYGYPALLERQASTNVRNMERNMIALQTDINSLTYKSVPYKETTMQVSGGALMVIPRPDPNPLGPTFPLIATTPEFAITYMYWDTTAIPPAFVERTIYFYPGELRYEPDSQDAVVEYENGMVHKRYWSDPIGSTTLSNPRWFIDEYEDPVTHIITKTLVITLIQITTEGTPPQSLSRNGISTVKMKVDPLPTYSTDQDYGAGVGKEVTITYNSNSEYNYQTAWENYFIPFPSEDPTGDTLLIKKVNRLVIKSYKITVLGL